MRDKLHSIFLMHENVDVPKKGVHYLSVLYYPYTSKQTTFV